MAYLLVDLLKKYLILFLILIILIYGFVLRMECFYQFSSYPLEPDVKGFYSRAMAMKSFYQASAREPLYIFVCKIWLKIFNNRPFALRLLSLFSSLFLIFMVYLIGCRAFSPLIGILSAHLVSINYYLIYSSIRGVRFEFFNALILCFIFIAFIKKNISLNRALAILTLIGASMVLVRLSALFLVLCFLCYYFIEKSRESKNKFNFILKISFSFLIILLAVFPYLLNNKRVFGEWFYPSNNHAVAMRNIEFSGKKGFPTREEIKKNLYAGEKITPSKYIFGMHTLKDVFVRYLKGYYYCFSRYIKYSLHENKWILPFGITGLFAMFFSSARFIPICMAITVFPTAFILPLNVTENGVMGMDMRFAMPAYPFFALGAAYFFQLVLTSFYSVLVEERGGDYK
ncbi:MAG: glycosyltransferase family 39 protein [Thermodesulfobacteriota bacterium]|nr:glycosyltransferase family 39 protein [Thermodesulfobacteriota bacterium]